VDLAVDGRRAHAATGGNRFDPAKPVVAFVSGAALDVSIWGVVARHFAQQGRSVMAVDLPGHGRSEGPALGSIPEMGEWLVRVLDAAGAGEAALVGFSMGASVALEAAANLGGRARALALIGAADEMPVHPDLLAAAEADDHLACELMVDWCHGLIGHLGGQPNPGLWVMGGAMRLWERAAPGLLFTDLTACNAYKGSLDAAARVSCPVLMITGADDVMTPPRRGRTLSERFADVAIEVFEGCGHVVLSENPNRTIDYLSKYV
jgi:pimeloyl-ACP methyl ester carboxylesterase